MDRCAVGEAARGARERLSLRRRGATRDQRRDDQHGLARQHAERQRHEVDTDQQRREHDRRRQRTSRPGQMRQPAQGDRGRPSDAAECGRQTGGARQVVSERYGHA